MLLSTPAFILHTTPYGDTSVVIKAFTRLLGIRSYIAKGIRRRHPAIPATLLQPLSCLDIVVYETPRTDLNHIKETALRPPLPPSASPSVDALRFFAAEFLYKTLPEAEPSPDLWDYIEAQSHLWYTSAPPTSSTPPLLLLGILRHLGLLPLDNCSPSCPLFDLQQGSFVSTAGETTLPPALSATLHRCLASPRPSASSDPQTPLLLTALIDYCRFHVSGFRNFTSHEILHSVFA